MNKKGQEYIGKKFSKLTVKNIIYNYNGTNKTKCECYCDCGNPNPVYKTYFSLTSPGIHSCGCEKKNIMKKYHGKEINGKKFGHLTVLETYWEMNPPMVKCQCDCDGNEKLYRKTDVQGGHTLSCGCVKKINTSLANKKDYTGFISDFNVQILEPYKKNEKNQWLWKCKCGYCNNIFYELPARILNNHVRSCGCLVSSSNEDFIDSILSNNKIDYIRQFTFDDCKSELNYKLRFDFAIMKNGEVFCLLEYDGEQHFKPIELFGGVDGFEKTKKRDEIKTQYCLDNNIILYRIPYTKTTKEIEEIIINIINP